MRAAWRCVLTVGFGSGAARILGCGGAGSGGMQTKVDIMCGASKVRRSSLNLISAMLGEVDVPVLIIDTDEPRVEFKGEAVEVVMI